MKSRFLIREEKTGLEVRQIGRLELDPDEPGEDQMLKGMTELLQHVSKQFDSCVGDIKIEGKEKTGYVIETTINV